MLGSLVRPDSPPPKGLILGGLEPKGQLRGRIRCYSTFVVQYRLSLLTSTRLGKESPPIQRSKGILHINMVWKMSGSRHPWSIWFRRVSRGIDQEMMRILPPQTRYSAEVEAHFEEWDEAFSSGSSSSLPNSSSSNANYSYWSESFKNSCWSDLTFSNWLFLSGPTDPGKPDFRSWARLTLLFYGVFLG